MQALIGFFIIASYAVAQPDPGGPGIPMPPSPPNPAETCLVDICGPPAQAKLFSTQYYDRQNKYIFRDARDFPPEISQILADYQAEEKKGSGYQSYVV